jgi:hypothetical protein
MPMDTINLHHLPANRTVTGADLKAAMSDSLSVVLELAGRDVASDLQALGLELAEVAPEQHRRLVLARGQWRMLVLQDRAAAAAEVNADYLRVLEDALLMAELQPKTPKKRSKAAH